MTAEIIQTKTTTTIRPAYEDDRFHYGSLGLPRPLPVNPPVYEPTVSERDYEAACQAVAGRRAEWITRPRGTGR